MPTKFILGEETYQIPKFKLREIRAAGPFIDRVVAKQREMRPLLGLPQEEILAKLAESGGAMASFAETMGDIVRVIAVGVLHARGEHPYTVASIEAQAELIEAEVGVDQFGLLNTAFEGIAEEAGMNQAGPPVRPAAVEEPKVERQTE